MPVLHHLSYIITSRIKTLSARHPDYGRERCQGENAFQAALHGVLSEDPDLAAQREVRFPSQRFLNTNNICVDHVVRRDGESIGVELKYVYRTRKTGRPQDAQAMPYDLLMDCAKLETLIEDGVLDDGLVIGLTDFDYWSETVRDWWSNAFLLRQAEPWQALQSPATFKVMPTKRRLNKGGCEHPAIFVNDRFHILLEQNWEYCWLPYAGKFKMIVLRRSDRVSDEVALQGVRRELAGELMRYATLPFRDGTDRTEALRRKAEFERLRNETGACPICHAQRSAA